MTMQVFSREIHLLTRGSAALFALYILSKTKNKLIYIGALVMLIFDIFTFIHT